ncbi:helix-turn-helix domain-containing protein [Streptomyces sp. NPDC014864]|uniref:helix-turn-helix domain-containing protein n=1 Tax=Streptomyces sp. NPDC014864 TaxID=3364924 RepID=UPI0036F71FAC
MHVCTPRPGRRPGGNSPKRTGYGKSTISEALAGRRLPTWAVTEALATVLGADQDEVRELWVKARGPVTAQATPDWLTFVRSDIPELATGISFVDACAAAANDPAKAIASSWEVLRLTAGQISHAFYNAIPGMWSSHIVDTFRRAEEDGRLPAGAAAVANVVHYHHVGANIRPPEIPSTPELLQIVILAYRLAWQANDILSKRTTQN